MSYNKTNSYLGIIQKSWWFMLSNFLVACVISMEYINILSISKLIWPGESFHSTELGLLISIRLWIGGISALAWGYLVDHKNRKRIFFFGFLLTGLLMFFNGFLPVGEGSSNYYIWLLVRSMIGIALSSVSPNLHSMTNDLFSQSERSQFFGIVTIVYSIGQVFAMLISAKMFEAGIWREYFWFVGSLLIGFSVLIQLKFNEPKRGSMEILLKDVITNDSVTYSYKLNKITIKKTLLSRTNLLIFLEGIFSCIFFGILDLLLIPYIQDSPHNISASNSGWFSILFGLPGAFFGSIVFAGLSDRFSSKKSQNRIIIIILSLCSSLVLTVSMFLIPLPSLSVNQGAEFQSFFYYPSFFFLGIVLFFSRIVYNLFKVNQSPILQALNLPEAQGIVRSLNQFLEIVSYGSGPVILGIFLSYSHQNYLTTVLWMSIFMVPAIVMWVFVYRTINHDKQILYEIICKRKLEIERRVKKEDKNALT